MNLYYSVVFVTNMPTIMSTIVTTTLHGIPMMGTHLAMILIRHFQKQLLGAPRTCSRRPKNSSRTTFAKPVTIQNSTRTSRVANKLLFTAQSRTLCRVTIYEKQGDKTLFINSDQLLFTLQCPDKIIEVTIAFG